MAVRQADIARAIRAVQAAGLPVMRVVVRSSGVSVETTPAEPEPPQPWDAPVDMDDDTGDVIL